MQVQTQLSTCIFDDLFYEIAKRKEQKPNLIVAIDGNCGAGKTTLAMLLKQKFGAEIIAMDHFFLREHQRTNERLSEIGGNIDYERFHSQVLLNLQKQQFEYRPFNCKTFTLDSGIIIQNSNMRIIEGSYSLHPKFDGFYDVKIFLSLPLNEQIQRIRQRNGEEMLLTFEQKYIPMENAYFEKFNIKEKCDFLISCSGK